MANNVDTKKMEAMAASLQTYAKEVKGLLEDIEKAAKECKENLDDAYSAQALQRVSRVISQSQASVSKASILANKIQDKVAKIIEVQNM